MVSKLYQLKQMMTYIELLVEDAPEIPRDEIVEGMEVAIYLYDEREAPAWYRAVIRSVIQSISLAKVQSIN